MITNFGLSPSKVIHPVSSLQNILGQWQGDEDPATKPKICIIYMYANNDSNNTRQVYKIEDT
jgi:hypothetical protein